MFYSHRILDTKPFDNPMVIDHPNLNKHQMVMHCRPDNEMEDVIKVKDIVDKFKKVRYRVILSDAEHIQALLPKSINIDTYVLESLSEKAKSVTLRKGIDMDELIRELRKFFTNDVGDILPMQATNVNISKKTKYGDIKTTLFGNSVTYGDEYDNMTVNDLLMGLDNFKDDVEKDITNIEDDIENIYDELEDSGSCPCVPDEDDAESGGDGGINWWCVVISYNYTTPTLILKDGWKNFKDAQIDFFENVEAYKDIIDIEMRKCQSIEVFADKIEYKHIEPECCATCSYSKTQKNPHNIMEMVCTNEQITGATNNVYEVDYQQTKVMCNHYLNNSVSQIQLFPKVEQYGLCKFFKRK